MLRSKDELEDLLGSDPVNRKVFELFPYAYLVGGFIRDTYLGLNPVDRDFIVTYELSDFIDKLNSIFNASKVVLKDNLTIRLVLKDYKATIDVTRLYTPLYKDLYQRDFTINSIAYRPDTGIIDPTGGLEDLEYGLIKTIKEENLLKDPVRLIRAYRFLAELNGSIEEKTRQWIIKHKDRIKESAFERITLEIIKLLRADNAYRALFNGFKDSLLSDIFSLDISKLEYLIKNISYLFEKFKEVPEVLKKYLLAEFDMELRIKDLIVLDLISLHTNPENWYLVFSNKINQRLSGFRERIDKARCLSRAKNNAELYECFKSIEYNLVEFIFLSGKWELFESLDKYINISSNPVLTGNDIMKALNLNPGPIIGKLLDKVKKAQFEGIIKTKQDALNYLKNIPD